MWLEVNFPGFMAGVENYLFGIICKFLKNQEKNKDGNPCKYCNGLKKEIYGFFPVSIQQQLKRLL
jgi:hypothetical protein